MKNLLKKMRPMCMSLAMMMVSISASMNCRYWIYQDELPKGAKKLRKF